MELELGLALPISNHFPCKSYQLDLNTCNVLHEQPKNAGLGLEFNNNLMMIRQRKRQKRCFSQAFDHDNGEEEDDQESQTLSLLVWDGRQPNNDDDDDDEDGEGQRRKPLDTAPKKEEDDNQVVGWPPIRSWRKKLLRGGHGYRIATHQRAADNNNNNNNNVGGGRSSIYVKVKMEGVIIGRKIDLMLFDSYQALTNTLLNMFAKYWNGAKDDGPYILSYLDKDGDWLLAGDVPWLTFINSVQRMEILKRSN